MRGQQIIPQYARSEGRLSRLEHLGMMETVRDRYAVCITTKRRYGPAMCHRMDEQLRGYCWGGP